MPTVHSGGQTKDAHYFAGTQFCKHFYYKWYHENW